MSRGLSGRPGVNRNALGLREVAGPLVVSWNFLRRPEVSQGFLGFSGRHGVPWDVLGSSLGIKKLYLD